jgi:hypothetical protein
MKAHTVYWAQKYHRSANIHGWVGDEDESITGRFQPRAHIISGHEEIHR